MSWQTIIILQILASSGMTLFTRRLALLDRKLFFTIGVLSYFAIALMGFAYTILFTHQLPSAPSGIAWLYVAIEGVCIPAAWLLQYRIIGYLGASNAVVIGTLNNVGVALTGIIFLHEGLSPAFILGTLLIIASVLIVFRIRPDKLHRDQVSLLFKSMLVGGWFLLFACGMFFEKKAINIIGVWDYASFGWGMQFVGAFMIYLMYGRSETSHVKPIAIRRGLLLGLITSVAGGLFIYALSIGTLSHTIVATGGKVTVTMLLAALLFKEYNSVDKRLAAFLLSIVGLFLIIV